MTLLLPALEQTVATPQWVSRRFGDVRAFDRRSGREVWGPRHPFAAPSDLLVTNGILRLNVGAAGILPYLSVSAFRSGRWREPGCIALAEASSQAVLERARIIRATPEQVTVQLEVRRLGSCFLRLRRRERMVRITWGRPGDTGDRFVSWLGMPPAPARAGAVNGTGLFSNGLSLSAGVVQWQWPVAVGPSAFSLACWWIPPAASGTQAATTILRVVDGDGTEVAKLAYTGSGTKAVTATLPTGSASTAALTFSAAQPVLAGIRFDTTSGLVASAAVRGASGLHAPAPSVLTGAAGPWGYLQAGPRPGSALFWGSGTWGSDTWGGGSASGGSGVIDNVMVFEDRLSDAEFDALAGADTSLDGLPTNEGRMAWYAPLDTAPVPAAPFYSGAAMAQTSVDADGFMRFLFCLDSSVLDAGNFTLSGTAPVEMAAGLATAAATDDAAHQLQQFRAEWQDDPLVA